MSYVFLFNRHVAKKSSRFSFLNPAFNELECRGLHCLLVCLPVCSPIPYLYPVSVPISTCLLSLCIPPCPSLYVLEANRDPKSYKENAVALAHNFSFLLPPPACSLYHVPSLRPLRRPKTRECTGLIFINCIGVIDPAENLLVIYVTNLAMSVIKTL